jgi:sugar lactone lactonase YvrE
MNIPIVSEITGTNKTYAGLSDYNGGSNKGTGFILTASGNAITVGAGADYTSVEPYYPINCYDSVNSRIVQCWQESGGTRYLKVCVGSVSGTTITWGSPVTVKSWSTGTFMFYARIAFDPDSGNFCIVYRDGTNSGYLTSFCGTVQSGTVTATMGISPTVINSALSDYSNLCYDTTQNRFIIIYDQGTTNFYARAATCTGSGTGATLTGSIGSAAEIGSSESISTWPLVVHDSTAGKNVIGFIGAGNSLKAATATIDPSTNAITVGAVTTISGAVVTADSLGLAYDPTANKTLLVYRDNGSPYYSYYVELTVSGSDITASSSAVFYSYSSQYKGLAYNATEQEIVVVIGDASVDYNKGLVFVFESSNLTSTNLLGIASGAISDTATGTINTWGSRNEVQTGLTIGSDYYVQAVDGRIEAGVTNIAFDISSATYTQNFDISSQATIPQAIAFNPTGTKMFIVDIAGQDVNEYALSTGFDVSSASYTQNFSVASQDTAPTGISFNAAGTKMFVCGYTNDNVYEYTLSSGFNLSTASYAQALDVSGQDTLPKDVVFNTDGTKMFVLGGTGEDVNEYTLSAYDISTASFVDSFSVASQESAPDGIAFNTDGTKMFIVGNGDTVFQYNLSSGFDVSTASYASISFSVTSQETGPTGIAFSADGTKMFIVGTQGDDVNQYATTANSFSTDHLIGKAITATQINIKDYTG